MKILDFLCQQAINVDLQSVNKKEVVQELTELLAKAKRIKNPEKIVQIILDREKLGSTGIGQGIAVPHGKSETVNEMVAALGISKKGIEFDSLDDEPVYIVFLLIAPPDAAGPHLKALAKISRLLKDKFFRQTLKEVSSVDEVVKIISEEDKY